MEFECEFPRGDTQILKFKILDQEGNECKVSDTDKLYFTVKKSATSKKIAFQKTLKDGIEYKEDGYYYITINSVDTADLSYVTYGFDIQIKTEGGIVKTLLIGSITLTEEYTWKGDEN